jgi:hypothetical protein
MIGFAVIGAFLMLRLWNAVPHKAAAPPEQADQATTG